MDNINEQLKALKVSWARVYEVALANPSVWQPYLPNTPIQSLNETVSTIDTWLNRTDAPEGFNPGYQIAKATAAVFLPQLLTASQNLEAAQYNHFPNFINALTNTLAAIHTMAVYADKETSRLNADLSIQLSQSIALLNTAQQELADKKNLINQVQSLVAEIEEANEKIIAQSDTATETSEELQETKNQSSIYFEEINTLLESAKSHESEYQELISNNIKLSENLTKMMSDLENLQERSKEQERIIDSILPKGASAGLAAAFSSRGRKLELGKWLWMIAFVSSLSTLTIFAWHITGFNSKDPLEFLAYLASRLPLAAPLVWLGWFSAIQYGNIIRVQEDYAFKEATSKAYQGYRDHMEHLANVQIDEARTALTLLSEKTIEILSHEPLRIYGGTDQDATPAHGLARFIQFGNKKTNASPSEK